MSLCLFGVNELSGLAMSCSSVLGVLLRKNSINPSFRQNFLMSKHSSVRFSLGTGVNFCPYLHKADLALASIRSEDKLEGVGCCCHPCVFILIAISIIIMIVELQNGCICTRSSSFTFSPLSGSLYCSSSFLFTLHIYGK